MVHHARPQEALLQRLLPLDAPVGDLADLRGVRRAPYLVAVELAPLAVVELLEEGEDDDGVHEVDERVAAVALVLRGQGGRRTCLLYTSDAADE